MNYFLKIFIFGLLLIGSSLLNVVKALKELKGMDLDHLMTQVEILNALSPAANPEKETVASKQNVA